MPDINKSTEFEANSRPEQPGKETAGADFSEKNLTQREQGAPYESDVIKEKEQEAPKSSQETAPASGNSYSELNNLLQGKPFSPDVSNSVKGGPTVEDVRAALEGKGASDALKEVYPDATEEDHV